MVGMIALLSDFFLRFMFFSGGRGGRDNDNGNNPLGVIFMIVGFVLLIFAPIIATLMQFAVSRRRETLAPRPNPRAKNRSRVRRGGPIGFPEATCQSWAPASGPHGFPPVRPVSLSLVTFFVTF